ncbi:WD40-repeat-containing domain protein, partial [Baffinella frigidus]
MGGGENVTSLSLSKDGQHLLINVSSETHPEVHLWELATLAIVQRYRGHRQGRYILRSCFGGVRDCYVVSGSEDSQVYLWHRESGALLATLRGHSGTINTVAWSPRDPTCFVSGSDDNTLRLWGPAPP